MISLGTVLTSARDQHPAFTKQQTPDVVLVRFLSQYVRRLTARVLKVRPDAISTVEQIELPLADFEAGYTLPAYQYIHGGTAVLNGGLECEFSLIPWALRFERVPRHSGYIQDGTLFLTGWEEWWNGVDRIDLRYAPVPAALTSLTSTIDLPDTAEQTLTTAAANFMAGRGPGKSEVPIDRQYFISLFQGEEASFLDELIQRERVAVTYTRPGW